MALGALAARTSDTSNICWLFGEPKIVFYEFPRTGLLSISGACHDLPHHLLILLAYADAIDYFTFDTLSSLGPIRG